MLRHDGISHRQWLVVIGLAVVSLVLGTIGFMQAKPASGETRNILDALYNSMQLFHTHLESVPRPLPWQLQIARFLAPLVLVTGIVKAFIYAAHSHHHAFRHRRQTAHVVICGLGEKGLQLALEFRKKHPWVVVIEKNGQNEFLTICERERIHYIIGDATQGAILEDARVSYAADVIVVTPDDETNVRIALQLSRIAPQPGRSLPSCFVHLEDTHLRDTLQRHFERDKSATCPVRFFDVYDGEARRVLSDLPLDGHGIHLYDKTNVHVVIIGFGRMGRSLAVRAARMGHFANGKKLRLSILDRTADAHRQRFLFHYPALERPGADPLAICDLQFHQGFAESPATRQLVTQLASDPDTLLHIFICIDDNTRALEIAFRLQEALVDRPQCNLHVRVKKSQSLAEIFYKSPIPATAGAASVSGPEIVPFGMVEDTCCEDAFRNPSNERLAKLIHERFVEKRRLSTGRTPENDPAMRDWDKLADDLRDSNFQQADHLPIKLRAIDCERVPESDPRPVVEQFSTEELNTIAPLEHTRWNAERLLAGWRYGKPSDKSRRINENITGWESLDDSVKKYDYEAVEDIPILLAKTNPPMKIVRRKWDHSSQAQS